MAAADQTAKTATKAATKAVAPETVIATTSVLRKLDPVSGAFGALTMFATLACVGWGTKYVQRRKLEKEIENATSGHESRESQA